MFETANLASNFGHSSRDRINIIEFMIGQRLGLIAGNKACSWWVRHFGFGPADHNGSGPPTWRDYVRHRWRQDRTRAPRKLAAPLPWHEAARMRALLDSALREARKNEVS